MPVAECIPKTHVLETSETPKCGPKVNSIGVTLSLSSLNHGKGSSVANNLNRIGLRKALERWIGNTVEQMNKTLWVFWLFQAMQLSLTNVLCFYNSPYSKLHPNFSFMNYIHSQLCASVLQSKEELSVTHLNRRDNWSTDRLSNFPRTTQLVSDRTRTGQDRTWTGSMVHAFNPDIIFCHLVFLLTQSSWSSTSGQQFHSTPLTWSFSGENEFIGFSYTITNL